MPHVKLFYSLVLVLALSACAALQPRSFDQSLALGYASHTAVLQTAAGLLKRGQISKEDAQGVLDISDHSRKFLDAALAVKDTDVSTAQASLDLATNLLDQLSAYLQERAK